VAGSLVHRDIDEASGMVASAAHAGVFYVHNDSGDRARFFAIDASGADRGTFDVVGAENVDWEDAARGPCGGATCLYFGDIGGGSSKARAEITVYRVPEPTTVGPALGPGPHSVTAEAFPLVYPDGAHDAETLLVHPQTGVVTIVTKEKAGPSTIYELPMPLTPLVRATLVKIAQLTVPCGSPRLSGGDIHPAGLGVLIRTDTDVLYYPMASGQSAARALGGSACRLAPPREKNGESIAWTASGDGFVTLSEGARAKLHLAGCAP